MSKSQMKQMEAEVPPEEQAAEARNRQLLNSRSRKREVVQKVRKNPHLKPSLKKKLFR